VSGQSARLTGVAYEAVASHDEDDEDDEDEDVLHYGASPTAGKGRLMSGTDHCLAYGVRSPSLQDSGVAL